MASERTSDDGFDTFKSRFLCADILAPFKILISFFFCRAFSMHTCDAHFESDKQTMADAKTSCHKKLLAVLHCKNYCKIQLTSATAEYTILDRCLTLPKMLLKQVGS